MKRLSYQKNNITNELSSERICSVSLKNKGCNSRISQDFDEKRKCCGGLRSKGLYKKNIKGKPLVTIVTVVFNGGSNLEETIKSVVGQNYSNLEYIIVDGGSSDSTLDIIGKYEDKIDYWISEKDKGIYDAMNKGILLSSGEWINFMNSGDVFYDANVLESCCSKIDEGVSIIYSDSLAENKNTVLKSREESEFWKGTPFCHQSAIFKSDGMLYDTKYKISADYDYILRKVEQGKVIKINSIFISVYDVSGVSAQKGYLASYEMMKISRKYYNNSVLLYAYFIAKILKRVCGGVLQRFACRTTILK